MTHRTTTEQIQVTSRHHLRRTVKDLLHEGNVRRIVVKNASGDTVAEVPVTIGVVGLLAAPSIATLGALVGVAAGYSIEVERETPEPAHPDATTSPRAELDFPQPGRRSAADPPRPTLCGQPRLTDPGPGV